MTFLEETYSEKRNPTPLITLPSLPDILMHWLLLLPTAPTAMEVISIVEDEVMVAATAKEDKIRDAILDSLKTHNRIYHPTNINNNNNGITPHL